MNISPNIFVRNFFYIILIEDWMNCVLNQIFSTKTKSKLQVDEFLLNYVTLYFISLNSHVLQSQT